MLENGDTTVCLYLYLSTVLPWYHPKHWIPILLSGMNYGYIVIFCKDSVQKKVCMCSYHWWIDQGAFYLSIHSHFPQFRRIFHFFEEQLSHCV